MLFYRRLSVFNVVNRGAVLMQKPSPRAMPSTSAPPVAKTQSKVTLTYWMSSRKPSMRNTVSKQSIQWPISAKQSA